MQENNEEGCLAEKKPTIKTVPNGLKIIALKPLFYREPSKNTKTPLSSEKAQRKSRLRPKLHPSTSSHLQFANIEPIQINPLHFPYLREIFDYLQTVDNRYTYTLELNSQNLLFFTRIRCLFHLFSAQRKLQLKNETLLLAVHLFDNYLLKNLENFSALENQPAKKTFNIVSFVKRERKLRRANLFAFGARS